MHYKFITLSREKTIISSLPYQVRVPLIFQFPPKRVKPLFIEREREREREREIQILRH